MAVITPLRLIDVDASLRKNGHILFCEADHDDPWNWHIISHTWSKDVRALSKAASKLITTNFITPAAHEDLYRVMFEANNWLKEVDGRRLQSYKYCQFTCSCFPSRSNKLLAKEYLSIKDRHEESGNVKLTRAYLSIREFLEILHSQGVKKVWLDAICINQCSEAEKAREIPRMADYYKKSKACYVPINGFADEESGWSCRGVCNAGASSLGVKRACTELVDKLPGRFWMMPVPSAYNNTATKTAIINGDKDEDEDISYKTSYTGRAIVYSNKCKGCGGVNDYRLPPDKELVDLRWFNRVWTLQEFLLPRDQIYFVVQLESWMEEWLALLIEAYDGDASQAIDDAYGDITIALVIAVSETEGNITKAPLKDLNWIVPCKFQESKTLISCCPRFRCGSGRDLVQKHLHNNSNIAKNGKVLFKKLEHQKRGLYILNREVLFVVGCMAHIWRQMSRQRIPTQGVLYKRYRDLKLLRQPDRADDDWARRLHLAVDEICSRECHEDHSEDRILGLLGLLRLKEGIVDYTVTTGKSSPEQQLVDLANKGVFHEEMLLHFCFQNFHSGRNLPGMSWIPDLTQNGLRHDRPLSTCFRSFTYINKYLANNISVSLDGPITMRTPLVKGHMRRRGPSTLIWTPRSDHIPFISSLGRDDRIVDIDDKSTLFCTEDMDISPIMPLSWEFERDENSDYYVVHQSTSSSDYCRYGSIYLPFRESSTHLKLSGFECWMLPILQVYDNFLVWMICLCSRDRGDDVLHKIGTLVTFHKIEKDVTTIFLGGEAKIGGFENNLHEHVSFV